MITCPNCNKSLSDDVKFCDSCGASVQETVFCPGCGTKVAATSDNCPSCGVSVSEPVQAPAYDEVTPVQESGTNEKKPFPIPKKILILGGAAIALLIVIIVSIVLIVSGGGADVPGNIVYIQDDEMIMSAKKPWQVTDRLFSYSPSNSQVANRVSAISAKTYISTEADLIFFPDRSLDGGFYSSGGYDIYYRKLSGKGEATKVDSDITDYKVNKAGTTVFYRKDGNLYKYSVKKDEKEKIASDVSSFWISKDSKVLYKTHEDGVYYYNGKEKEKVASEVEEMLYRSDDLKTIYYVKEDSVYKQVVGKDKVKLVSDVSDVSDIYNNNTFYFVKTETVEKPMMDFVTDDINSISDAYEKAQKESLKSELKEAKLELEVNTIYFYNGKEAIKVSDNVKSVTEASEEAAVVVYTAYDLDAAKVKLSEINVYSANYEIRNAITESATYFTAVKENVTELAVENISNVEINDNGTKIFVISVAEKDTEDDYPVTETSSASYESVSENTGDLYLINIKSGKVGKAELYDSDVYYQECKFLTNDKFAYYKDYSENDGELYINKERIDSDVFDVSYSELHDKIFVITDYDEGTYTLKTLKKGKTVKIADDVDTYTVAPNGTVLYITDYSDTYYKGELRSWNGSKSKKIADDVAGIVEYGYYTED